MEARLLRLERPAKPQDEYFSTEPWKVGNPGRGGLPLSAGHITTKPSPMVHTAYPSNDTEKFSRDHLYDCLTDILNDQYPFNKIKEDWSAW